MRVHAWRILRKLGEGGYGYVYLVDLPEVAGEPFTLKLSKFRQGEGGARADKERVLLSRVEHPNIVQVFGHGHWPHPARGWPYLLLEYVEGPSLWQWLEQHNPTPRDITLRVAALADALATVHERGALHRDVKGENILVRASDGQPVLLDFGVGDYEDSQTLTVAVLPPGTAHYRSPESLRFLREHRDTKARYEFRPADDLYALGVLFFRLLADEYPFPPSLPPDLLYADIEQRPPPAPDALNPRVPPALSALVLELLAKRPEERPASARALHAALLAALPTEKDAAWDRELFEWVEDGTPHSLTTDEAPRAGVASPSPSADERKRRFRRRQVARPPSPSGAPRERSRPAPRPVSPLLPVTLLGVPTGGTNLRPRYRWGSAGALLAMSALVFAVTRGEPTAPPLATPPLPEVARRPEALTSLSAEPLSPSPGSAPEMNPPKPLRPPPSTPTKRSPTVAGSCLALAATASIAAGCASAPLRPRTNECPREAVQAMKKHGIKLYESLDIYWDASDYEEADKALKSGNWYMGRFYKVYSDGPTVGRVAEPRRSGVPEGTLLYGYIWVDATPEFAVVRIHEALLPNGRKIPVCMHTSQSDSADGTFTNGSMKHRNSKPQAAIMFGRDGAVFVDRYPARILGDSKRHLPE